MRKSFFVIIFGVFAMALPVNINAQEKTNNDLQLKAIKDARKEAKKLIKEGFQTSVGKLPLDKQLENAAQKQVEADAEGNPYWYVVTSRTTGDNKEETIVNAINAAKNDLTGQVQTRISQLISASNNIEPKAAENLLSMLAESNSTIFATLNRTIPLVEIYRTLPDDNVEVYVTLGYSLDAANQAAVKAIRATLIKNSESLARELDKLGY